ncbi:MAG TPA: coenzyme F420-0:L-glutamate ligase [Chloroflexia bacterium]|nr:coenzyme F420-0:L-glutamate ligase [Chloroflexia bacterium]
MSPAPEIRILALGAFPEVTPGMDLHALITAAATDVELSFAPGDILVVTQKIVSKAEGALVDLRTIEPSDLAVRWAAAWDKDPRQIEVVLRESKRIVRMANGIIISETHHGFVCANAGVDASNVAGHDTVSLLPRDSDASAARLRATLSAELGFDLPVIISDSFGRAWRHGIINVAVGLSGLGAVADYRGRTDAHGYLLNASILAVADELAAAAELIMGKLDGRPVAVIRGYAYEPGEGSARDLLMDPARDLFR